MSTPRFFWMERSQVRPEETGAEMVAREGLAPPSRYVDCVPVEMVRMAG